MKKLGLVVISFLLLGFTEKTQVASVYSFKTLNSGHESKELCNFFPANRLRFPIRPGPNQLSRQQFRKILDATQAVYQPIFQSLGLGKFYVVDRWFDDTVNACASIGLPCSQVPGEDGQPKKLVGGFNPAVTDPTARFIEMYGGLARHPFMSSEGLMLVICHEIGHHLGGAPRYGNNSSPMSVEGQADYFATAKCARMIYAAMSPKSNENWAWTNKAVMQSAVAQRCQRAFPNQPLQTIACVRSSLAGLSLARVLGSLRGQDPTTIDFNRRDPSVVMATFESHPEAQCRLDTYIQGALCQQDASVSFSMTNPNTGACVNPRAEGARPSCWYSAKNALFNNNRRNF